MLQLARAPPGELHDPHEDRQCFKPFIGEHAIVPTMEPIKGAGSTLFELLGGRPELVRGEQLKGRIMRGKRCSGPQSATLPEASETFSFRFQ